jgi:MFS family permease
VSEIPSSNSAILSGGSVMGVALGALFGGKLINAIGRKPTVLIGNAFIIIFSCLSIF